MSKYTEALAYAARFCATAERCKSDVLEKIRRFDLNSEEQHRLIQKLENDHYLDEQRYIKAFINDHLRIGKWGRIKIHHALRLKGLPEKQITQGLETISMEEYRKLLRELLRKKSAELKGRNAADIQAKIVRFALGRGFELSEINREKTNPNF